MRRGLTALLALALLGGGAGARTAAAVDAGAPQRVISVDYCADQFVLRFLPRRHILALSPDATKPFSYMRASAAGLPSVRPTAEDVLVRRPDLVVRAYGGGPRLSQFLQRAGVPVLEVGAASDLADVAANVERLSAGLGNAAGGQVLLRRLRERLAALPAASGRATLYLTPTGYTSGPGTLVHELLLAAGLRNFSTAPGWHPIPLERLAYEQPSLVAAAFFGMARKHRGAWSAARHPVARGQLAPRQRVALQGAWTACGGWFLIDAIETLARGAAS